jgi:hypothetical protein
LLVEETSSSGIFDLTIASFSIDGKTNFTIWSNIQVQFDKILSAQMSSKYVVIAGQRSAQGNQLDVYTANEPTLGVGKGPIKLQLIKTISNTDFTTPPDPLAFSSVDISPNSSFCFSFSRFCASSCR